MKTDPGDTATIAWYGWAQMGSIFETPFLRIEMNPYKDIWTHIYTLHRYIFRPIYKFKKLSNKGTVIQ